MGDPGSIAIAPKAKREEFLKAKAKKSEAPLAPKS
jgi:hypothetical protein